ncbi:MAG: hypothetical protein K2N23_01915 [Clostridia bacterium]|nr:hypothetical protein [Clostridia bacterium]
MQYDVISITDEELKKLKKEQVTLLRTAQQKKDELVRKAAKQMLSFKEKVLTAGMKHSSLYQLKHIEVYEELNHSCTLLADNLIYNMSLFDNTESSGGSTSTGYLVDYSLSYNERYMIVRNYYLKIEDVDTRMAKYSKDETAKKYLGSYYGTLYNVLATYEK